VENGGVKIAIDLFIDIF